MAQKGSDMTGIEEGSDTNLLEDGVDTEFVEEAPPQQRIDEATLAQQAETPPLHTTPEDAENEQDKASEEGGDKEQKKELPTHVPHAKYNQLYHRNKTLESRTDQILAQNEQYRRYFEQQQATGQQPQAKPEVDLASMDPMDKLDWLAQRTVENEKLAAEQRTQAEIQQQQTQQQQQVLSHATNEHQRRIAEQPQYADAYQYLMQSRLQELLGSGQTEQSAEQIMRQEEYAVYADAQSRGALGSNVIMSTAMARGWKPQEQAPGQEQSQDPGQETMTPTAREEQRQRHISLSTLGSTPGKAGLTAKDLARMDEDEFALLSDNKVSQLMRS